MGSQIHREDELPVNRVIPFIVTRSVCRMSIRRMKLLLIRYFRIMVLDTNEDKLGCYAMVRFIVTYVTSRRRRKRGGFVFLVLFRSGRSHLREIYNDLFPIITVIVS